MKHTLRLLAAAASTALLFAACDDTTSSIGSSLIEDQVEIIVDSTYTLTGHPVKSTKLPSRTILQLLGRIDAEGYGTFSSDVVTQLMPSERIDTTGVTAEDIDSVKLIMRMPVNAYVGDSLTPMGLQVYPLNRQLPLPIYSDFNASGYYDSQAKPLAQVTYSMGLDTIPTSALDKKYRYVEMHLGKEFGQNLYKRFKANPETFATTQAFNQWFPGLYIRTSFGQGRVVQIDSTVVTMYYRQKLPIADTDRDTILFQNRSYLAVTPEILTNNNMAYGIAPTLSSMAQAGEPILVAPTGYDVELTLPAQDILNSYRSHGGALSVINTLTVSIPVEDITNDYGITAPPYVLLVKKSLKDNFFAKSMLPDNTNSFYAPYNSSTHSYTFTNMRSYLLDLLAKDTLDPEDSEFVICPVTVALESTSSTNSYYYYYYNTPQTTTKVSAVTPYVNRPSMCKLLLDKAKVTFTYSKQSLRL